jgi:site-specific recombinase XerD
MSEQAVVFNKEVHRKQLVLSIFAPNAEPFNSIVRKLGCTYSATKKMWWIPFSKDRVNKAFEVFKNVAWVDYSAIATKPHSDRPKGAEESNLNKNDFSTSQTSVEMTKSVWTQAQKDAMWAYADKLRIRKYSQSTFKTYGVYFKKFLAAHPATDPKDITEEQIIAFVTTIVRENNYANKTQNQIINALKFYYEKVLGQKKHMYWIPRPRKETKLPVVASEEEVIRLFVASDNLKHQCIMALLYSSGLRRGELIDLCITDINIDRRQIFVRGGKGRKDRTTILSDRMANALIRYFDMYKPGKWVFEGPNGKQYTGESVGAIVKHAATKAGIKTKMSPHVLRHSFATHLMDKGTDTRYIQELLGHASLETTAIYAHVSTRDLQKIKSPLDRIFDEKALKNKRLE